MSFRKELRVIPRNAWITAFALYTCFVILIHFLIPLSQHPGDISTWPIAGQLAFTFFIPVVLLVMIPLWGYVYGDAKRRGMRYVMWTLLSIFVPDLIGLILYFILRDPLPLDCPSCHQPVLSKFTFCPRCGATTRPTCPQCGKNIEEGWTNCGYCGTRVPVVR